jgi:hypothetical protein
MNTALLLIAAVALAACSTAPAPVPVSQSQPATTPPSQPAASSAGDLKYQAPAGWVSEPASSSMRVAQYRLPRADGDSDDAQLALFYFGQGQGGSVEANLDRWVNQMVQPDGSSSKAKAKTETMTVKGLRVTLLDVTGTYNAEMSPGSGSRHNSAGYRMRAAVVETPKGPYFAKLVGPEKTIAKWDGEFRSYIGSFEFR